MIEWFSYNERCQIEEERETETNDDIEEVIIFEDDENEDLEDNDNEDEVICLDWLCKITCVSWNFIVTAEAQFVDFGSSQDISLFWGIFCKFCVLHFL